jgi:hypothetical protein
MSNKKRTSLALVVVSLLLLCAGPAWAQFYVDPAFSGAGRNGSSTAPWQSLSDSGAWAAINAALPSADVTVYFSATGSSAVAIGLGSRTDASTHTLTLDGISQKDTNSASPSWATNVVPSPCKYDAAGCGWASASKFTITATTPLEGTDSPTKCIGYFIIQGFTIHNTEGQTADLAYVHDVTFQFNDASRTATGSYGPGIYVGPANSGPGCGGSGPNNVTIQYNHIHETWGECIYVGATTPDPPGGPGNSEYVSEGLTCGTACMTGDDYLIQGNVVESCASWGGQGDGTDIKDGHTNLRILDNTYRTTKACTSCGSQTPGNDGQGIVIESGALLDGNYIEAPGHDGIAIMDSWNNSSGRSGVIVRNNIIVNITSGIGHNLGVDMQTPQPGATVLWGSAGIYNNSIYQTNDACIGIDSGNGTNVASIENNVGQSCAAGGLSGGAGTIAAHDYNDFYDVGNPTISYGGSFSCPSITASEAHSLCDNPLFVSTATPYADVNFTLQSSSPVATAGLDLSTIFTDDYFGAMRMTPWDMGAAGAGQVSEAPAPPTGLTAVVH